MSHLEGRTRVQTLRNQQIREVANAAMGAKDVLGFWFGESHLPTPEPIRAAGAAALASGATFYTPNLGLPELREAVATYLSRLHRPIGSERVAITSSGVSALMIAMQALLEPGDSVVIVTPVWPNLQEMPKILGAEVIPVPLRFGEAGWRLDLDQLLDSIQPGVKAVFINSPNNPTGWTLSRAEQEVILARCRQSGVWLIADDVYERLYFAGKSAPSFLEIVDPKDRFIGCNSFSKAWRMTGWRAGWAVMPEALTPNYAKLIEYNTSCVPGFIQAACRVALTDCEADVEFLVEQVRSNQRQLHERLSRVDRIELGAPAPGGMYAFFRIEGLSDSLAFCKSLVRNAKIGLAPGSAFGDASPEFVRWCIATDPLRLTAALDRFIEAL
ncbi:pyridoxal phosphate-dependent aminotransferase [Steroidobacter sp.]|uniref:pyridoxal phosphate-dependent aminotransferase n=1 Tax=Steroidobacter sp. TaxID=1978227 RepID=UPI001A412E34|nr:pyridoxal phosphate-dependent aminotransferase [Steroidobacter sp.]MBL8265266.1 pyridoxal phosphate-dependent aminotransferase [Steroidobacter sp.]